MPLTSWGSEQGGEAGTLTSWGSEQGGEAGARSGGANRTLALKELLDAAVVTKSGTDFPLSCGEALTTSI